MNNPYAPPGAHVEDPELPSRGGVLRIAGVVLGLSLVTLTLSWILAPMLASELTKLAGLATNQPSKIFLLLDLIMSCAIFFFGCFLGARASKGRPFLAALGIGLVGWLVYFVEVGGLYGMLYSKYPLWYEFFPSHLGTALFAAYLVRHLNGRGDM